MNRTKLSKHINQHFFYGWIVVFAASLSNFFSSPGQTYSISAFTASYIADFNYSSSLMSTVYSAATIASGLLLVFVGKAVDRFGQRKMFLIIGISLAFACLFNSFIINIPMIFIGFFLLRYLGQGSLTLIPNSLVPQWFEKNRAFPMSLLTLGLVLGKIVFPNLNIFLISTFGWRSTWQIFAIGIFLIFLPLMWLLVINKPEDIGLFPDNVKIKDSKELENEIDEVAKSSFTLSQALKKKEFWFIGIISMIIPMITTGMTFHFYTIMSLKGFNNVTTSMIIGLSALPALIIPIVAGVILDRLRSKHIIFISLGIILLSLVYFQFANSILLASIFMLVYNFTESIMRVALSVIWPNYFGRLYLGSIRGAATVFIVVGSALGAVPFGLSYDITGTYIYAFMLMGVFAALGMGFSLAIKKPKKQ